MVWSHSGALSLSSIDDSMPHFPRVLFIGRNHLSKKLSGGPPTVAVDEDRERKSHALARFPSQGLNRGRNSGTLERNYKKKKTHPNPHLDTRYMLNQEAVL